MKTLPFLKACVGVALVAAPFCVTGHAQSPSSNVHVWVTGLNGPRGLRFGSDGKLYVAEAGTGGTNSTKGTCTQVIPPAGPELGGSTARISAINSAGTRTTVASGLPSSINGFGDRQGVADLEFLDGKLYALVAGGGCSHGDSWPAGIYTIDTQTGAWKLLANLSHFIQTHPVKYPNPADFEPDGSFYSMTEYNNRLYAVEPNHGQIISVGTDGSIVSVMDVSATQGHIVPTGITAHDGQLYLGNLNQFPIEPNFARVLTLGYSECSQVVAPGLDDTGAVHSLHVLSSKAGFTTVVAVRFGPDGLLYVLEMSDAAGFPAPGAGKVVRVKADGSIENVATGLTVPTGMTFGPDGELYVSNFGAGPNGAGQIVRIDIP